MSAWLYVFLVAELISFGAALLLVVAAFRVGVKWGLLTMFVPFGALVFACKYWKEGGVRFVVCATSCAVYITVFLTHLELFTPYLQQYPQLLAALQHSPFAAPAPPPPPEKLQKREAVDVADAQTTLSQRDNLIVQQTDYTRHVVELNATYEQLKAARAKLKGGGPALAAYNAKAARYQESLRNLQMEKIRLDSLQHTVAAAAAAANATVQTVANVSRGVSASANSAETPATRAEMDTAVQRITTIVNQVPPTVIKPPSETGWIEGFHPGATKPDFDKTDIVSGRQPYDVAYIQMEGNPNVFYRGADCEFNSQTKFFYTHRELPKKRLTDTEYQELVRLYRFLGKCQRDLNVSL